MITPSRILVYSRPHDMRFHANLIRIIEADLPGVPVLIATFFKTTLDYFRQKGREVVYLPDALKRAGQERLPAGLLERIEAEAVRGSGGANLQLMLQAERFLHASQVGAEAFLCQHVNLLEKLVLPGTLSLGSMYDHFVYWLAGSLANARSGWHFGMVGSAVPVNRTIALRTPWDCWRVEMAPAECDRLLQEAITAQNTPVEKRLVYMAPMPVRRGRGLEHYLRTYGDVWYDYRRGSYFAHHWLTPGKWLGEKLLPRRVYRRMFEHPEPRYDLTDRGGIAGLAAPFVYLPLHMEPEATLLMYSPWCRDQIEAVRLVSQAMPVGWKLVVKENPKMRRARSLEYYRRLNALPNVVLADPSVPSTDLSRGARATISIAGNASLEAELLGRPGYCLGRPPFRRLLSGADFSSSLRLAELFDGLRNDAAPGIRIPVLDWRRWVEGTVPMPFAYKSFGTDIGIDDSDERTLPMWRYMQAAMVQQADGPDGDGRAGMRVGEPTKGVVIESRL